MRLSFYQVAAEVLEHTAADLAVLTRWREKDAGWGLIQLYKWVLARCPDDAPPSMHGVVTGPDAARLIAAAMDYPKGRDPETLISAGEQVCPPVFERVEGGIRIRGVDRYDSAWGKNHPDEWRAFRSEAAPSPEQHRSESVPEPERNRPEVGAEPARKIKKKIKKEDTETCAPDAPAQAATADEPVQSAVEPPTGAHQAELVAAPQPKDLQALWNEFAHPSLPRWCEMPEPRRRKAQRALRQRPIEGPRGWRAVIEGINASAYCRGEVNGWRASPDWLLQADTASKVLEGNYQGHPPSKNGVSPGPPLPRIQSADIYSQPEVQP